MGYALTLSRRVAAALAVAALGFACSRTGLPLDFDDGPLDGAVAALPLLDFDAGVAVGPACTPEEETCNGRDDDCDGDVDEVTPIPCPGGGSRYCVGGQMSECPRRCDVCLPGSLRICFTTYCTFWGEQTCAADGRGFGPCVEERVPRGCEDVAMEHQNSPELEQCCIDKGYCCMDDFDLDSDGDRRELLGRCDEVSCQ